jgi:hypothetical protein
MKTTFCERERLDLHRQRRHLQQTVVKTKPHTAQLLGGSRDFEWSTSLVRPAQPDTKLLPPSPYQRPATRQMRAGTAPSGPATSTRASFLSTLGMWRQGCGNSLFPHQSPLSAAEFPRHSWRQRLGRIGREAQHAYIIINSLETDM